MVGGQRKLKRFYRYLLIALVIVLGVFLLCLILVAGVFLGLWGEIGEDLTR